jgi:hypothetical protein
MDILQNDLLVCALDCYLDKAKVINLKIKDAIIYLLKFYHYCLTQQKPEFLENIKKVIDKICANEYLKKNFKGISTLSKLNTQLTPENNNIAQEDILRVIQELQNSYFSYAEIMDFFGNCAGEYLTEHLEQLKYESFDFTPSDKYTLMWSLNCYVTEGIPNHRYIAPELISAIIKMFKIYQEIPPGSNDIKNIKIKNLINSTVIGICGHTNLANNLKEIKVICSQFDPKNDDNISNIINELSQYLIPIEDVISSMKGCLDLCMPEYLKQIEARLAAEKAAEKARLAAEKEEQKKEMTKRNQMAQQDEIEIEAAAEKAAKEAEMSILRAKEAAEEKGKIATDSKNKARNELRLINAWAAVSTNNILDTKKTNNVNLTQIQQILLDKNISTIRGAEYDENSRIINGVGYIIPDKQFSVLLNEMKNYGITTADIKRHQNERSDFKAKNNTFTSASMSKTWKNMPKMPWSRGGRKTRKARKPKKPRKTRKTMKPRKGRVRRRTNKR